MPEGDHDANSTTNIWAGLWSHWNHTIFLLAYCKLTVKNIVEGIGKVSLSSVVSEYACYIKTLLDTPSVKAKDVVWSWTKPVQSPDSALGLSL